MLGARWLLFFLLCCCGCWTVGLSVIMRGGRREGFRGNLVMDLRGQRITTKLPSCEVRWYQTLDTCGEVRGPWRIMGTLISWDSTLPRPRSRLKAISHQEHVTGSKKKGKSMYGIKLIVFHSIYYSLLESSARRNGFRDARLFLAPAPFLVRGFLTSLSFRKGKEKTVPQIS